MASRVWQPLVLLSATVVAGCGGPTEFERQHAQMVTAQPMGLTARVRTSVDKSAFTIYEPISVEVRLSSAARGTYTMEMSSMNHVYGQSGWAVSNPEWVVRPPLVNVAGSGYRSAVVCCAMDRRPLDDVPVRIDQELTEFLRFTKPGRYQVYFWTRRVFDASGEHSNDYDVPSTFVTVSNVVTFDILPDDPAWSEGQLGVLLDGYDAARTALGRAPFERRLTLLDTPAGIAARVARLHQKPEDEWRFDLRYHTASTASEPLFISTIRPDLAVAALEARVHRADIGVDNYLVDVWAKMLIQRDHGERFNATFSSDRAAVPRQMFADFYRVTGRHMIDVITAALGEKSGMALKISQSSIDLIRESMRRPLPSDAASEVDSAHP